MITSVQRYFTPGVFGLLALLFLGLLIDLLGGLTGAFNPFSWLALSGEEFAAGRIWQILTYVLMPDSLINFLINVFLVVFLGGSLERYWSRREFWGYGILVIGVSGLAQILLRFHGPGELAGAGPLCYGLLAAWGYVFGHEKVPLIALREIRLLALALIGLGMGFVMLWISSGLISAIIAFSGAGAGVLYLGLRNRWIMSREGVSVASARINRLEL